MSDLPGTETYQPDPAAVFAGASSLWDAVHKAASAEADLNLSNSYNGLDQLMREVMRIANNFEAWACLHVDFNETSEVWPYFLEDKFGQACLSVMAPTSLALFNELDSLRVAMRLRLPIRISDRLPVPVAFQIANPIEGSGFPRFQIRTVRNSADDNDVVPYVFDDDPADENFSTPYFALYGIDKEGYAEHIADRANYSAVTSLLLKLVPEADIPTTSLRPQKTNRQSRP